MPGAVEQSSKPESDIRRRCTTKSQLQTEAFAATMFTEVPVAEPLIAAHPSVGVTHHSCVIPAGCGTVFVKVCVTPGQVTSGPTRLQPWMMAFVIEQVEVQTPLLTVRVTAIFAAVPEIGFMFKTWPEAVVGLPTLLS